MHTEEDTYNRLRRPSLKEMVSLVVSTCKEKNVSTLSEYEVIEILTANYWTYPEYITEYHKIEDKILYKNNIRT